MVVDKGLLIKTSAVSRYTEWAVPFLCQDLFKRNGVYTGPINHSFNFLKGWHSGDFIKLPDLEMDEYTLRSSTTRSLTGCRVGFSHDARRIMEIPVDAYGGWAFDFFGNFWLSAGGTWVTYLAYCVIMGFALGICIRAGTCLESILQVKGFSYVIFIMTLLLVFENRVQVLFLWTFIVTASAGLAYFARLPIKNENRSQNHSPSI